MESHAIDDLGVTVKNLTNIDSLNNCSICGKLTRNQICDRCKKLLNKEECCD